MVQDAPKAPQGYRERQRAARRREFLDVARRIVNTEGQDALTMQRVTDEVGSSTGGIYNYFPTKDSLLAALQHDALDVMLASYLHGQTRLEKWLADHDVDPATRAVTRVVAMCRFWIESEETLPSEIELSRRLIAGAHVPAADPQSGALPVALRLLDEGRQRLDAAVECRILDPGNNLDRSVMVIASVTGVLLTSKLGGWDNTLFDGKRIARQLVADMLIGWGAPPAQLAAADERLAAFSDQHHLAPRTDSHEHEAL